MLSKKTIIIAKREFRTAVKNKMFLFLTLAIPIFFVIIALISFFHSYLLVGQVTNIDNSIGIVDKTGLIKIKKISKDKVIELFDNKVTEGNINQIEKLLQNVVEDVKVITFKNHEEGLRALNFDEISVLYIIPKNYLSNGNIRAYSKGSKIFSGGKIFLKWILRFSLLSDKIPLNIIERVQDPINLTQYYLDNNAHATNNNDMRFLGAMLVSYMSSSILMLTIFLPASYLLQSISEEKDNRIFEIIISSVSPEELLTGKMLGLGLAGLVQTSIWIMFILFPLSFVSIMFKLSFISIFLYLLYIVLGFLLFGSIMAGIGVIGIDSKQSAQFAGGFSLVSIFPLLFLPMILIDPNGILSKLLSYFPLTSPTTMMVRLATGSVGTQDVIITMLILIPSIYFVIRLSARIFKTGVLMYGKKIGFKEFLKWMKQ